MQLACQSRYMHSYLKGRAQLWSRAMASALSQLEECYGAMRRRPLPSPSQRITEHAVGPRRGAGGVAKGYRKRTPGCLQTPLARLEGLVGSVVTNSLRGPACTLFRHLFNFRTAGGLPGVTMARFFEASPIGPCIASMELEETTVTRNVGFANGQ